MKTRYAAAAILTLALAAGPAISPAFAAGHGLGVKAQDQMIKDSVKADMVMTTEDGWLVIHRVKAGGKPGPVIGHAWLKKGKNENVVAKLTGKVKKGEKVMLMIHGEKGGKKAKVFEYTLGSKLDGPIRHDGKLVMTVVTAK